MSHIEEDDNKSYMVFYHLLFAIVYGGIGILIGVCL